MKNISQVKNNIIIEDISNFNLDETFNCGQCFRWNKISDNYFTGIAFGKVLNIYSHNNTIVFENSSITDYNNIWHNYFDLNTDYNKIKDTISKIHPTLKIASTYAPGIRILKQDPWEALCSFIISQNNNIPRIKGIVERLCNCFGNEIQPGFFSFPSYQVISTLSKNELAPLKCGFRDNYIIDAAKKVSSGEINFEKIKELPIDLARKELMKIKGVGPKVAECTLLYGLHRLDAFPIDVWMSRALKTFFPDKSISYFGEYAGIAQQYIFHYTRMNPDLVN